MSSDDSDYDNDLKEFNTKLKSKTGKTLSKDSLQKNDTSDESDDALSFGSSNESSNSDISFDDDSDISEDDNSIKDTEIKTPCKSKSTRVKTDLVNIEKDDSDDNELQQFVSK